MSEADDIRPDPIEQALLEEMQAIPTLKPYEDDDPRAVDYAVVEQFLEMHNRLDRAEATKVAEIEDFRVGVEAKLNSDLADIRQRRGSLDWNHGMGVKDAVDRLLSGAKRKSVVTTRGTAGWRARGADTAEFDKANKAKIIAMCQKEHPEILTTSTPVPTTNISKEKLAEHLKANKMSDLHGLAKLHEKGERTFYHKPPKESDDDGES